MTRPTHRPQAAGIGLRAQHHERILATRPRVGWFEAHPENYFAAGGAAPACLERVRADYPLSLHGVGLSLGSCEPLDLAHVAELARLVRRFEPFVVSEHLSWGAAAGRHGNDLLPLPYTEEALQHVAGRVRELQERLGRQVLIENLSSYLEFGESTLTEWDFLAALVAESGCGLLFDVNNAYVNQCNHGGSAERFIDALPQHAVGELHLAGHSINRIAGREIRIDTHGSQVCEEVWALFRQAVRRFPRAPALIEWDTDIPALEVLVAEAGRADAETTRARAATTRVDDGPARADAGTTRADRAPGRAWP
ncbi:MAG: DUF692 domain-containing protein [Steroidobacteraceae bacterium]